jgi:Kef-type K+ transport system membrane component KefB
MNPLPILLLQLVVILGTARMFALLLRRFGQPAVIGEMLAGIALGPIVFGWIAPEWQAALFAKSSLAALDGLSQIGLVLFMFIVGAELRLPGGARRELTAASLVSLLSVLLPMALGLAISPALYPRFAPEGVAFWPFALFMATSMAITAFPVMARILRDRGVTQTTVGRLALTSAAVADVLAWVMLALVVALISARGGWSGFLVTVFGTAAIMLVMFVVLRPLLARLLVRHAVDGKPSAGVLALLLIGLLASSAITDVLGLHAVFGAFLFGAALPRDNRLLAVLVERIETVAVS